MSKSIKEIRLHGSSVDLRDPVNKKEESFPQTGIHVFRKMSSSLENEDEQNNTSDKSDPHAEITQDFIKRNNTPDKKNKCASLLDKLYTSLRCLGIWVTVITLLFLIASVVCGVLLNDHISNLEKTVSSLQRQMTDQQINKDGMQNVLRDQKTKISDLDKAVNNQQITISSQTAIISSQSAIIRQLQHKTDTDVFFTARHSSSIITVPGGQTVVYGDVITSMGEGYDVSTGIFRAQKSGCYRADVHAVTQREKLVALELQHNGGSVVSVWCDKDGGVNNNSSCSNSAIVRLNKGDSLKVVADIVSYLGARHYNSFSVQLLSVV